MHDAGLALNATFKGVPVAGWVEGSGTRNTTVGKPIVVELPDGGGQPFDYVVTMEDLRFGQRIANYSIEFQASSYAKRLYIFPTDVDYCCMQAVGSTGWTILVPPVVTNKTDAMVLSSHLGDRPDGHDPRDQ